MGTKDREQLEQWSTGFWTAVPILTAQHIGIFERLAKAPKTPAQLRRALAADERALRSLLDALLGMGLIVWKGEQLTLAPRFAPLLDPASPDTIAGMLDLRWHLLGAWMRLESAVLDGPGALIDIAPSREDSERERAFNRAMRERGRDQAAGLIRAFDFSQAQRVLDIGGGPGAIAAEICTEHTHLVWTLIDRPGALTMARRCLRADALADRVTCLRIDALADDWPTGHDTVLMSHLIHAFGEDDVLRLLAKSADALPHRGHLILRDFISRHEDVPSHFAGLFGINMLVNTEHGRVYSLPELKRMLPPALRFVRLAEDEAGQTLIARKR